MLTLTVGKPEWQKAVAAIALTTEAKARLIVESVGKETVAYLKSRTEQDRGWVNRSGELARSYRYSVAEVLGGAALTLYADADHAIYLEARDGLFVLNGITDRGGPIEQALREVCAAIAPEFTVVRS